MECTLEPAFSHKEEIRELFQEYTDMLVAGDPLFAAYLELQNYDDELAHLEHKYGLPKGRLYLLYCDGEVAGCIGLKQMDPKCCELKRLYIKPAFRGRHLSDFLVEKIINDAKEIGYKTILLDTLPFLTAAIALYKKHGFREISKYNGSPMENAVYMQLDL